MKLYVAGPMSPRSFGLEHTPEGWDYNYPAFEAVTAQLREAGYEVESPAEPGQVEGWSYGDYIRRGLVQLLTCDGVAVLPGWDRSTGAQLEVATAGTIGMTTMWVSQWLEAAEIGGATFDDSDVGRSAFAADLEKVVAGGWLLEAGTG